MAASISKISSQWRSNEICWHSNENNNINENNERIIKSISSVKYQQRKHGENGNEMVKIIEMEIIEM
jgi:hypothetical protein